MRAVELYIWPPAGQTLAHPTTAASLSQQRPPPTTLDLPAGMDPPQHLLDQIEAAQNSRRGRYRGGFSRRLSSSPAWAGIVPGHEPPRRTVVEAAVYDPDPEEEAYAAGVAGVAAPAAVPAAAPTPVHAAPANEEEVLIARLFDCSSSDEDCFSYADDEAGSQEAALQAAHMDLNAQRAANFMATRQAQGGLEQAARDRRRAELTEMRQLADVRRKRQREAAAAAAARGPN